MKKVLLFLTIILLTGCQNDKYYTKNLFYMDTIINVKIYSNNQKKVDDAFQEIEKIYKKYDEVADIYNDHSELYRVNHSNGPIVISDDLLELIKSGQDWYNKSNGLLNINIGSLTSLWHEFRNNNTLDDAAIKKADISNDIIIDGNTISGTFHFDLGSIAKGYATEQAGQYLESMGLNYYIINAGGNVKVGKSYKGYYTIGVQSPIEIGNFYVIKGMNISVVTSGGYERYYEYNGNIYHHIIDPNTRYPANYVKSVTIIGNNSALCDALSTTLFLMNIEDGKEFIKDYDVDVIWFTNDNKIVTNEGFRYE